MHEHPHLIDLETAWEHYRSARVAMQSAANAVALTKANLSAAYRSASDTRVTIDMVNAHCLAQPKYLIAARLWAAVAQLERASVLNGMPGQRLAGVHAL